MPQALDTISGFVTAPGSTFTPWTLATGDSLSVRTGAPGKGVSLIQLWAYDQGASGGTIRVHSPRMHDNVQGVRVGIATNDVEPKFTVPAYQPLYYQDTLTVEQTGSGTAGQIESGSLLVYYEDLPGVAARFMSVADLQKRMVNMFTSENAITPGSAGGYSGAQALNTSFDLMKANTDYALLGYRVSARCCTVAFRGTDTGNLRVSGPGEPSKEDVTSRWFVWLSDQFGMPLVPVFNSANKQSILIDIVQNQAAAAVTVSSMWAQLSPA